MYQSGPEMQNYWTQEPMPRKSTTLDPIIDQPGCVSMPLNSEMNHLGKRSLLEGIFLTRCSRSICRSSEVFSSVVCLLKSSGVNRPKSARFSSWLSAADLPEGS